jgi:hypothetical protein
MDDNIKSNPAEIVFEDGLRIDLVQEMVQMWALVNIVENVWVP